MEIETRDCAGKIEINDLDTALANYLKLSKDLTKENEVETLKEFIDKTFECVSLLFDFPINRLKSIVKNFWNKIKE